MSPKAFYENQLPVLELAARQTRRKVSSFALMRLFIFLLMAFSLYFFWNQLLLTFAFLLLGIPLFLFAISQSVNAKTDLEKVESKIALIRAELKQLKHNRGQFDPGRELSDPRHAFSYDLDLFAEAGFFAYVNRTASALGKQRLAERLLSASEDTEAFEQKTEALSGHIAWTQDFRAAAIITSRGNAYNKSLSEFASYDFRNPSWVRFASWLVPVFSFTALLLDYLALIPGSMTGLLITASLVPAGALLKETNRWASQVEKYESRIRVLLDQLILLQSLPLDLVEKSELKQLEKELRAWTNISRRFEIRLNILVSIPLNIFLAWDLRQRLALEKWSRNNNANLENWENGLADVEVLITAAVMRFNNREVTVFSRRTENGGIYSCKGIVHPLIPVEKRVKNDFELGEQEHFIILTGPNMAGKSTYLRAVGINLLLAGAGFPVFADSFEIPRLRLFTSMRTSDDLSRESSYFHAELMRLKYIQQYLGGELQTFILLDEILKGTNSKDKEEGSKKFLLKMKKSGARGIIATHDLSLCSLADEDTAFKTCYFDSAVIDDELYFDYRIKAGVCRNMNASFLLKKLDLID